MKKFLITLVACLAISFPSFSQITSYEWAGLTKGALSIRASAVEVDSDGNVIVIGGFNGQATYCAPSGISGPTISGANNLFIQKVAANGDLIWIKEFGGGGVISGEDLVIDSDGDIYLAGLFNSNFSLETPGIDPVASNGMNDAFLVKWSAEGEPLWGIGLGGSENDAIEAMAIDAAGYIYVMGFFEDTLQFDPNDSTYDLEADGETANFIAKYDKDGTFIWSKKLTTFASGFASPIDAAISVDNDLLFVGAFTDSIGLVTEPEPLVLYADSDNSMSYLARLDLDNEGELLWATKALTESEMTQVSYNSVNVDAAGNSYVQGFFNGEVSILEDGIPQSFVSGANNKNLILKLDGMGNTLWGRQFSGETGGARVDDLALDLNGNVHTVGYFFGTVDFDPTPDGVFELTIGGNPFILEEHFLATLTSDGDFVAAYQYGGEQLFPWGNELTVDEDNIYIIGGFLNEVDMNPFPDETDIVSTENATDSYLIKLKYDVLTSTPRVEEIPSIRIYPNPVYDFLMLEHVDAAQVSIYNSTGQLVHSTSIPDNRMALPDLPSGMYILHAKTSAGQYVGKFIKE
jgi:hypothetical protein